MRPIRFHVEIEGEHTNFRGDSRAPIARRRLAEMSLAYGHVEDQDQPDYVAHVWMNHSEFRDRYDIVDQGDAFFALLAKEQDDVGWAAFLDTMESEYAAFLDDLHAEPSRERSAALAAQLEATEEVVTFWQLYSDRLPLGPSDRRLGDGFAAALAAVIAVPHPPEEQRRSLLNWFGEKANLFVDEAVKTAGKLTGAAIAGGAAYGAAKVTGTWDELGEIVKRALGVEG